ncbi:MAG: ATP-binding protein [Myxococcota bacterium]
MPPLDPGSPSARAAAIHERALEVAGEAELWLDPFGVVTWAGAAVERLLGRSAETLVGHALGELLGDLVVTAFLERLERDGEYSGTVSLTTASGELVQADLRGFPAGPHAPAGVCYVAVVRAMPGQTRMHTLLHHLVEGTASATGEAFFDALVRELARALKVHWAFVAEVDAASGEAAIRAIWGGDSLGEPFRYPLAGTPCERVVAGTLCHFPGGVANLFPDDLWLTEAGVESYMAIPLFGADGETVGHLGIMDTGPMVDDTLQVSFLRIFAARASAELIRLRDAAALAETARELARSNEELTRFSQAAAHDLQQPLTQIMGFIDLLQVELGADLTPRRARYIESVADGSLRMSRLIDSLLAYARAGGSRLEMAQCALREIVELAQQNLATDISAAGAHIEVGPLPTLESSAQSLLRVFQNLLANAIKFHQGSPRIKISAHGVPGGWAIEVTDDGIGIDPADHERIFDAFERVHGRAQYPGSGIGLATCRKLIERLGGELRLRSAPGAGSTFTVVLPTP